jgi:Tfp pilus assembly protein PilN
MKAVNLIPSEQRRARPTGSRSGGAYVVVGVLGVLLVMAVLYVMSANQVNDRETKAAEARQEADALEAQAKQLGSFTNFASIKEQRLASVISTSQTRFDWERLMRELAHVMPDGSWLQTAEASVVPAETAGGTTGASTSTPTPGGPSTTLAGCTPNQPDVARLLVRLRQMHRVTEVTLNESVRQSGGGETTFDSCGDYYQFNVTVSFAPVAPVEAPRGASSVPASLGGGS